MENIKELLEIQVAWEKLVDLIILQILSLMVVVEEVVILYSNQLHDILQVLLVKLLRSKDQLIGLVIDRDQVEEVLMVKMVHQDKVRVLLE
tara:strand:+ start:133 stop:405 length:273 start_codon:yes stop_codon:yes gene_type:complete